MTRFDRAIHDEIVKELLKNPPPPRSTNTLVAIRGADPNQKLVLTGLGERGYVQSGALLPYRIDFENDTNATAPAQAVFVTDRLASGLDWPTFELTEIGFGDERITLPMNTQHFATNLPVTIEGVSFSVQIEAGIRIATGEVFCTFRSLDLDTDLPPPATAGFLPPENGTGRGQGFVSYVVRIKADFVTGTEIRNVALIDFDGREVVATDQIDPHDPGKGVDPAKQALVTLDDRPPDSAVIPLADSQTTLGFMVSWSGTDAGSGVDSYDIYVSDNASPWTAWQLGTTNTSGAFLGLAGHRYDFFSVARDPLGNLEAAPAVADATTTVSLTALPSLTISIVEATQVEPVIQISFSVSPGYNHVLEFRETLSDDDHWSEFPSAPHNSGRVLDTSHTLGRYYRLRQIPQ